ncbi:hypothetical protein FOMA001_g5272 [Fusarium oxysporum f. sp. matthiolae]|nr:hypothetical protein FOMA001_g5272 [Fusarium oxysporum f. sp. matthiolae]
MLISNRQFNLGEEWSSGAMRTSVAFRVPDAQREPSWFEHQEALL